MNLNPITVNGRLVSLIPLSLDQAADLVQAGQDESIWCYRRCKRSQRALERIGARREGVVCDHMILPDGAIRSSVYYSILAAEWPDVKRHLAGLMREK
jgi:hypothetical protein